jgi:hypothetical protein
MAYSCGISLFCFILFWLANSDPAFAEGEYLEKISIGKVFLNLIILN